MEKIAKSYYDNIPRIKKNVEDSREYERKNIERFHRYKKFIFESTLSKEDRNTLAAADKPAVEVNVVETYLSRLWGEWSKQIPDLSVRATTHNVNPAQIDVVEGILRSIFSGSEYENHANEVYRDTMSGGYSAFTVFTEYENESSMRQVIRINKVYDPTLVGFDPLARDKSKADAQYCYQLVPKYRDELELEYPDVDFSQFKSGNLIADGQFRWCYSQKDKDILYVADYFEKKYSYITMYEITDPTNPDVTHSITKQEYNRIIDNWDSIMEPPQIINEDKRKLQKIMRYKFIGDQLIERPEETDFDYLPLVFVDGNSAIIEGQQLTRPYAYNTMDAQKVKNLAASNIVNDLENTRQTDVLIAKESLPSEQEYIDGWLDPQKTKAALVYDSVGDDGQQLPPPNIFPRSQVNGAFMQIYEMQDKTIQSILGSYDAQLGIQQNQLSGVAIVEGATQSNNAAMPYVINYLTSLSQVAKVVLSLIPKYYKTLRTVPTVLPNGKHVYTTINDSRNPDSAMMDFEKNDLQVDVKAGANFDVQRTKALQAILQLMQSSQTFNAMINTKGLPILIDNLDIRGKDQLKDMTEQFLREQEQKQAQAAQQPNPQEQLVQAQIQLENQKLQLQGQKQQTEAQIEGEKLKQAQYKLMAEIDKDRAMALARMRDAQNEADRTQAQIAMDIYDQQLKTLQIALRG
jgi:hypothetical protein